MSRIGKLESYPCMRQMRFLLASLIGASVSLSCFGQGQVHFNNRVPPGIFARITDPAGMGIGEGFTAQLFGGPAGTPLSQLTPLFPTTTFRSGNATGYVVPVDVTVPGVLPGEAATLVMRVFNTGLDFFSAPHRGETNPITVTLGGGIFPPANLVGLQGIVGVIPEPSPFAVTVLGLGLLSFAVRLQR